MKLTGAEIIWECLLKEGVEFVWGYPGGAILPTYDALSKYDKRLKHVLVRHEQGATHMADGYARATGKVGVAMATSGPGATNMVTGIATAMMDSSPIVCITGQVPSPVIGTDAFQETDVTGVTLPITKHNFLVTDIRDLVKTMRKAFFIARTGRPGPVLVDIAKDVQNASIEFEYPTGVIKLPGYTPPKAATAHDLERAAALIKTAKKPLILAGHGVNMSGAERALLSLAEIAQIPVALTLLGKGAVPESHPLCLGMMGMHGAASVNQAIQSADLLIACGMRFDDRVTGNLKTYSPNSQKIHIDIDASELNKAVKVDVGIAGDLRTVLEQLSPHVPTLEHRAWLAEIRDWQEDGDQRDIVNQVLPSDKLYAAQAIRDLWTATRGDAIVVTDVGQHQMWEAQYYLHDRPRTLITSGGLGTMGFGLPAAIGAKMGCPDETVWAVVGDGGFQMTLTELGTAAQENVDVNIAIINNSYLGMVRQWQEFFYEERYNATPLRNPDFCMLAAAYGIPAFRVTNREEIPDAVAKAQSIKGPTLVEFRVESADIVYPMVPAGADLHAMIRRPMNLPDWSENH
ncbi:MAG TPA: biosynthetic-type acetolactate synthase large subunit [Aggregatilineales bacterium]|nr:biosynthetic-type acetolactate synthase large subunit [Anaerolineales bacterium]HRE49182.1 biosynthetic-type acetolactate synthase large subunit [Aggregatilineales bacterium]